MGFRTSIHLKGDVTGKDEDKIYIFVIYDKNIHRINRGEFVRVYHNPDTGIVQSYSVWKSKDSSEKSNTPLYFFGEWR